MNMLFARFMRFRKEVILLWKAFWAPETPGHLKAATLGVVLYLLSPIDLVPDFIPFLGWLDDMVIVPVLVSWIVSRLPVPVHVNARAHEHAHGRGRDRYDDPAARTIDGTSRRI